MVCLAMLWLRLGNVREHFHWSGGNISLHQSPQNTAATMKTSGTRRTLMLTDTLQLLHGLRQEYNRDASSEALCAACSLLEGLGDGVGLHVGCALAVGLALALDVPIIRDVLHLQDRQMPRGQDPHVPMQRHWIL